MLEVVAFVVALLGPVQLGRDIKVWMRSRRESGGKASWPVYQGWRAWLFPLGDVLGVVAILFALSTILFHRG